MVERTIEEIHSDHAKSFLLFDVGLIEQPNVDDDLARLGSRLRLKTQGSPTVGFTSLLKTPRGDGIGKDEEGLPRAKFRVEPFDEKIVLLVKHRVETNPADVALRCSVNCVAEGHVVGGHRLGDRAGCPADAEKSTRDFLAGANFCERAVLGRVEIDLERLSVGAYFHLGSHTISLPMIRNHRKCRPSRARADMESWALMPNAWSWASSLQTRIYFRVCSKRARVGSRNPACLPIAIAWFSGATEAMAGRASHALVGYRRHSAFHRFRIGDRNLLRVHAALSTKDVVVYRGGVGLSLQLDRGFDCCDGAL